MVIEFLASHQLNGINLYITSSNDNLSGKYVLLTDYQKLKTIIQRVIQLAYSNPTKEELAKLLADCEEATK